MEQYSIVTQTRHEMLDNLKVELLFEVFIARLQVTSWRKKPKSFKKSFTLQSKERLNSKTSINCLKSALTKSARDSKTWINYLKSKRSDVSLFLTDIAVQSMQLSMNELLVDKKVLQGKLYCAVTIR